jgi:hypothetical protein
MLDGLLYRADKKISIVIRKETNAKSPLLNTYKYNFHTVKTSYDRSMQRTAESLPKSLSYFTDTVSNNHWSIDSCTARHKWLALCTGALHTDHTAAPVHHQPRMYHPLYRLLTHRPVSSPCSCFAADLVADFAHLAALSVRAADQFVPVAALAVAAAAADLVPVAALLVRALDQLVPVADLVAAAADLVAAADNPAVVVDNRPQIRRLHLQIHRPVSFARSDQDIGSNNRSGTRMNTGHSRWAHHTQVHHIDHTGMLFRHRSPRHHLVS